MTGQTSASEVLACVCLAISLFSACLVPWFLLVEAERLAPRPVRELAAAARAVARDTALSAAVLLMLVTAPEGALR